MRRAKVTWTAKGRSSGSSPLASSDRAIFCCSSASGGPGDGVLAPGVHTIENKIERWRRNPRRGRTQFACDAARLIAEKGECEVDVAGSRRAAAGLGRDLLRQRRKRVGSGCVGPEREEQPLRRFAHAAL